MAKHKRGVALFDVLHRDDRSYGMRSAPRAGSKIDFGPILKSAWERSISLARRAPGWVGPTGVRLKQFCIRQSSMLSGAGTAFALIGAILFVRHFAHPGASPRDLAEMDRLRAQQVHSSVLDVKSGLPAPSSPEPMDQDVREASDTTLAQPPIEPTTQPAQPTRVINLNYILVQSYSDKKIADSARKFLNLNGVPCTIEQGVKNWRKDFYLVIGLQGFARISSPEYLAYRKRIEALSIQFAPQRHSYRGFQPMAIKWDRAN